MVVYVARLRRNGVRLQKHEVLFRPPIRGRLRLEGYSALQRKRLVASLYQEFPNGEIADSLLPSLHYARVTKISAMGLIVVGVEAIEGHGKRVDDYRQAWWCIPPTPNMDFGR